MNAALPNLLSAGRLAAAPLLVGVAALGSRAGFVALFGAALLTDALDGFLARRWHAESELGRKLDSWADYATLAACAIGLWLLWPEVAGREWPWFVAGLGGCLGIVIVGLLCWRKVPGYHTWLAKALAVGLPVTLVPLLAGWSAIPFHVLIVLQILSAVEELAIACILPGYSGEVATVWHAWSMRPRAASTTNAVVVQRRLVVADARSS
jgi:cardiolipin synthase